MISGGNTYLFADWSAVLGANICKEMGYNVYLKNPCDQWGRTHVYEIFYFIFLTLKNLRIFIF